MARKSYSCGNKSFRFPLQILLCFAATLPRGRMECISFGTDFVNNGGPYCINTTSTDFFSFGTEFFGCVTSDSQGSITPILIDPRSDEHFCSDISTTPDGKEMVSVCNRPGDSLSKSDMITGSWTVVIEGLTFAWMRVFAVIAAPPMTVYSTPTATFTITSTPTATSTSTSTLVVETTLPASIVTYPSETLRTSTTITPKPVTTTITELCTITSVSRLFSRTFTVVTSTVPCKTTPRVPDPTCTIRPTKARFAAATNRLSAKHRVRAFDKYRAAVPVNQIHARAADACTTTIMQTTKIVSVTSTEIAPTSTLSIVTVTTAYTTITPTASTVYLGKATTTITVILPTKTISVHTWGTIRTTVTRKIVATITSTVKVVPSGVACL